jgi:hypothetical protein
VCRPKVFVKAPRVKNAGTGITRPLVLLAGGKRVVPQKVLAGSTCQESTEGVIQYASEHLEKSNMSKEQGAHSSGKPTEPREGNGWHCGRKTPKATKVEQAKGVGVVSLKNAERQNLADEKKGKGNLIQLPAGKDWPTTTGSGN